MERQTIIGSLSTSGRLSGALSVGGGTTDYNELENKPTYNGHVIEGELTNESLGIWQPKNFSTEEQNTGLKWIDGKDIYERIITPLISTNNTLSGDIKYGSFLLANYISNVDMAWIDINISYYMPATGQTRGFISAQYEKDVGNVTLTTMYSRSNVPSIICVRYTKN